MASISSDDTPVPFVSIIANTYPNCPVTHCPHSSVYAPRSTNSSVDQTLTDQSNSGSKPGPTQLNQIQNYKPPHKSVKCWTYIVIPPYKPNTESNEADAMDVDSQSKTKRKKNERPPLSTSDGAWIFASHEKPL